MKILVADDDAVSRRLTQRTLEKFGYEVLPAEDGRQALEILSQEDGPRLALVDWMMPELDGPALCREVRAKHRDAAYVYIVLLTSKQGSEDIVAGLEAGADDYLTKPFQMAELRARLHTGQRILLLEDKLVQAREEMRYRATHDALTALWNRASILTLARVELQQGARENRPVSLLLCDIDHFKRTNDNHGHLAGDLVLVEVSKRLKNAVRSYDAVGRYGGEEFLIVLSDCDTVCVETRAEAIREAIANDPIQVAGICLQTTISLGAVTRQIGNPDMPLETLLAEADAALYRAKAEGRNRCIFTATAMTLPHESVLVANLPS